MTPLKLNDATGSIIDPMTGKRQMVVDENGNHFVLTSLYGHAYAPEHGLFTIYSLIGDWFAYLMVVLVIISVVESRLSRS